MKANRFNPFRAIAALLKIGPANKPEPKDTTDRIRKLRTLRKKGAIR